MGGRIRIRALALAGALALVAAAALAVPALAGFGAPVPYDTDTRPADIAIGKLDADGRRDIVLANRDGRTVSVLYGEAGGSFADAENLGSDTDVLRQPKGVSLGDVAGDGRRDIVASGDAFNKGDLDAVLVFRGRQVGFANPREYEIPGAVEAADVTVDDLDRDGHNDVAISDFDEQSNSVWVLYGTGSGLADPKRFRLRDGPGEAGKGRSPQGLAVADLDRDGVRDLAVTSNRGEGIWVLWGKGSPAEPKRTFTDKRYETDSFPLGLAVSDLDRDGRLDLVAANDNNVGNTNVSVLYGKSNRGFKPFVTYDAGDDPGSVAVGKLDDDGRPDLAVTNFSDDEINVLYGEAGGFAAPDDFPLQTDVIDVAAAQLDGEGGDDLVTALFNDARINVILAD